MLTRSLAKALGEVVVAPLLILGVAVPAPGWGLGVAGTWLGSPAAIPVEAGDAEYVVRPGDTLWAIAEEQLGDPYRWSEIAASSMRIVQRDGSRLTDPGLIRPGWTLALPSARVGLAGIKSAVLTRADWTALQRRGSGYPELADVMERRTAEGGRRLRMMLFTPDAIWEQDWASDVADSGVLGTSAATFIDSQSAGEFPVAGSQVTLLRQESGAAAALGHAVEEALAAPGGQVFDVPGVEGAIGVRHWTPNIGDFIGYTWNVYFTHGPTLARVFIAGGPDDETFLEDEADGPRNRQWAVDAAGELSARLDRILGRGSNHAPAPDVAADPEGASAESGTQPIVPQRSATIDIGWDRTCALAADGRAWCWGAAGVASRDSAQTPGGDLTPPTEMPGSPLFDEISADGAVCGRGSTGQVWCWGANGWELVADGRSFSALFGTCAVEATGTVWCWGDGPAEPLEVGGAHILEVIAAGRHTCALDQAGQAWCWGLGESGELGGGGSNGSGTAAAPVAVAGGHAFVQIAVGEVHTCALDMAGQAWCWGFSSGGALGEGRANAGPDKLVPVAVAGGHKFTTIDAGGEFTCAIDAEGRAWCWGRSSSGVLGTGETTTPVSFEPVPVAGGHRFTTLSLRDSTACALDTSGRAWCWGDDQDGQLGQSEAGTAVCDVDEEACGSSTPVAVIGSQRFRTA